MTRKLYAMKIREPEIPDDLRVMYLAHKLIPAGERFATPEFVNALIERIARSETREKVLEDALRSALEEYDSRKEDIMTMDYAYAIAEDTINKVRDALERKG